MPYVLKSERHYLNGTTDTWYHVRFLLGLNECGERKDAKIFRTKKEAKDVLKYLDRRWEIEEA